MDGTTGALVKIILVVFASFSRIFLASQDRDFSACRQFSRVLVIAMQKKSPFRCRCWFAIGVMLAISPALFAAEAVPPIKALLITGGCCHDYENQKGILKLGIEARANVIVDVIYVKDSSTHPALPIYGNPNYANGYDVIIHDECAADISDPDVIQGILKPHQDGIPGVNLHCAMHSYRIGEFSKPVTNGAVNSHWYEYLGLQSTSHGPQEPIAIAFTDKSNAITTGLTDWTTIHEEHYNNIRIFDTAHTLASGTQIIKNSTSEPQRTNTSVVVWTNTYKNKTRVFSTTIGHNNETVADARYLDLVTRGLLWACDKLDADGRPKPGYAGK